MNEIKIKKKGEKYIVYCKSTLYFFSIPIKYLGYFYMGTIKKDVVYNEWRFYLCDFVANLSLKKTIAISKALVNINKNET